MKQRTVLLAAYFVILCNNGFAQAKLAEKVKKGGTGVWGQIPMPPNPQVSDADMKALIQWILSQK